MRERETSSIAFAEMPAPEPLDTSQALPPEELALGRVCQEEQGVREGVAVESRLPRN